MARLELSIQPSLFDLFYEEFLNQFMAGSDPSVAAQGGDRHSYSIVRTTEKGAANS
jgi:hypothetical protein